MQRIWLPLPTKTLSSMARRGGRNTSPCTSFQPNYSCASSCTQIYKLPIQAVRARTALSSWL